MCVRVNVCQVKLQIDVEDNRKDYAYHKKWHLQNIFFLKLSSHIQSVWAQVLRNKIKMVQQWFLSESIDLGYKKHIWFNPFQSACSVILCTHQLNSLKAAFKVIISHQYYELFWPVQIDFLLTLKSTLMLPLMASLQVTILWIFFGNLLLLVVDGLSS